MGGALAFCRNSGPPSMASTNASGIRFTRSNRTLRNGSLEGSVPNDRLVPPATSSQPRLGPTRIWQNAGPAHSATSELLQLL